MSKGKKLTKENKMIELYHTPIGHDTIDKLLLQLSIPTVAITNPIVANTGYYRGAWERVLVIVLKNTAYTIHKNKKQA